MAYNRVLTANWGPSLTGHAAQLGYSVTASDGTVLIARTTSGISEVTAGTGYYKVTASFDDAWTGDVEVLWDMPSVTAKVATERLTLGSGAPSASDVAAAVRTNLTTELGRIDVATSTRLASASYSDAPTAEEVADAVVERTLGGGANLVTVTAEDEDGEPLSGVLFRVRLNSSVQAEGVTDGNGLVEFALDDGTYKLYGERTGYDSSGLVDLVVNGDTEAEPYELTAQVPAETTPVGTVEIKVPLGKMLVAQEGVQVYIKIQAGTGEVIDLGGQVQYRAESQATTDASGYATFTVPLSSTLVAAELSGRYLARTVQDYIPENSWFEVTGPGVVTLNDPD